MRTMRVLLAFICGASAPPIFAQNLPATVAVYAQHQGGDVVYHYQIRNNGPGEISEFFLGCQCVGEIAPNLHLHTPPVGISAIVPPEPGESIELPRESHTLPDGWRAYWFRPIWSDTYHIYWRMAGARTAAVASGETVSGFSVRVPGGDPGYLTGYYTVRILRAGELTDVSGPLNILDNTAPVLNIQAAAQEAFGEPGVYGQIRVSVKDDRDPSPRVVAESIQRDESGPSRLYRITYSATDASGNRATATTLVRLPLAGPSRPSAGPPKLKIRNNLIIQASLP
jgi:hypothetical protein